MIFTAIFLKKKCTLDIHYVCLHNTLHVMTIWTRFDICWSEKVKSGEGYPSRLASFGLTPISPCTDNTLICLFGRFYGVLRLVVWPNIGHFWGVYISHNCVSKGAFLFSFVCVMYLNIASYYYGKQRKSKFEKKLYEWMIFLCIHLNHIGLSKCLTMTLNWSALFFT